MRRNVKTSFRLQITNNAITQRIFCLLSDFTNNVWEFISMNKMQFGVLILSTLLSQAVFRIIKENNMSQLFSLLPNYNLLILLGKNVLCKII